MADITDHVIVETILDELGITPDEQQEIVVTYGEANDLLNTGDGEGEIRIRKVGTQILVRSLRAGPNVTITQIDDDPENPSSGVIEISSTGGAGGGVAGPDPSEQYSFAIWNSVDGAVLGDSRMRLLTDGGNTLDIQTRNPTSGTWESLIERDESTVEIGVNLDALILRGSPIAGPYYRDTDNPIFHEEMDGGWTLPDGAIASPWSVATNVLSLRCLGTNGGISGIKVSDVDPVGNVTGAPGELLIRQETNSSALYQHRGTTPNDVDWTPLTPQTADEVPIQVNGGPPLNNVQDTINQFGLAGANVSGQYISDAGGGTVNVAAGNGWLRSTDDSSGELFAIEWGAQSGISVPVDSVRYFGVEWNGGSPQVVTKTGDAFNHNTEFRLGSAVRENGILHILENPHQANSFGSWIFERFMETRPFEYAYRIGGIIPSETGARQFVVSAGELYDGLNEFDIDSIDTSSGDAFDAYYRDGVGGWNVDTSRTQWDNQNWDDGTGTLDPLLNNRWAVHWLYIEADGSLVTLYGQAEHLTEAAAEQEPPPADLPLRIQHHGRLFGRLIFQQGEAGAASISNVWTDVFASAVSGGDVNGPASATDNEVPRYDGVSGKLIQGSGVVISDGRALTGPVSIETTETSDLSYHRRMVTSGANGADVRVYAGDRDPTGVLTAIPGSTYNRSDGSSSAKYVHVGSAVDSTSWRSIMGNVVGPSSSSYNTIPLWDASTGELLKSQGLWLIDPSTGLLSGIGAIRVDKSVDTADAILRLENNLGEVDFHVRNTSPVSAITGNPGALCIVINGTSSTLYQHRGSIPNNTDWVEVSSGGVEGPGTSTDNAVVRFDGTDGTTLQNSGVLISDGRALTGPVSIETTETSDLSYHRRMITGGANSADVRVYAGNRSPYGVLTGVPGSVYHRSNGSLSDCYVHQGAGVNNTGWKSIKGNVVGTPSSSDNAITRYNGTTGELIQSSNSFVDDGGNITTVSLKTGHSSIGTAHLTLDSSGTRGAEIKVFCASSNPDTSTLTQYFNPGDLWIEADQSGYTQSNNLYIFHNSAVGNDYDDFRPFAKTWHSHFSATNTSSQTVASGNTVNVLYNSASSENEGSEYSTTTAWYVAKHDGVHSFGAYVEYDVPVDADGVPVELEIRRSTSGGVKIESLAFERWFIPYDTAQDYVRNISAPGVFLEAGDRVQVFVKNDGNTNFSLAANGGRFWGSYDRAPN